MGGYYNREGKPIALEEWAISFELNDRRVAETYINNYRVSTVFLGLDHRFGNSGPPLIFETMVFNHTLPEPISLKEVIKHKDDPDWEYPQSCYTDLLCERYSTEEEALKGHDRIVKRIQSGKEALDCSRHKK